MIHQLWPTPVFNCTLRCDNSPQTRIQALFNSVGSFIKRWNPSISEYEVQCTTGPNMQDLASVLYQGVWFPYAGVRGHYSIECDANPPWIEPLLDYNIIITSPKSLLGAIYETSSVDFPVWFIVRNP